ncbi:terminase small subunit-like protein [Paracoccus phage Shpa]|uniref:Terminase small subunit-like protein n=1 Tax=Paracoccus phage Shpa TaxID=1647282 RepID=A0A0U2C0X7_9CAUD|nr:terminase small subunit-like protein [Paracoccus phage Shpa]AKG94513.1 terminase small subunit-like protein [Paracoccus phage Shpa]
MCAHRRAQPRCQFHRPCDPPCPAKAFHPRTRPTQPFPPRSIASAPRPEARPSAQTGHGGAAGSSCQRHRDRSVPKVSPLGAAPKRLSAAEKAAWVAFADEMPWLGKSDRTVVELASRLRAAMETNPDFPIGGYAQLRMCLSAMDGTPADRSKVAAPDDEDDDPLNAFMQ